MKPLDSCQIPECNAKATFTYKLFGQRPVRVCSCCHFTNKHEIISMISIRK